MATKKRDSSCAICGRDYVKCQHPWHLPFQRWGQYLVELKARMPVGPNRDGSYDTHKDG